MKRILITKVETEEVASLPMTLWDRKATSSSVRLGAVEEETETIHPRTFYRSRGADTKGYELAMTSKAAEVLGLPYEILDKQAAELSAVQSFRDARNAHITENENLKSSIEYLKSINRVHEKDIESIGDYINSVKATVAAAPFWTRLKYLFTGKLYTLISEQ